MTSEWERDAAEMARYLEDGETLQDYPEEYWRQFDLLYAAEKARVEEQHQPEITDDQEFPW